MYISVNIETRSGDKLFFRKAAETDVDAMLALQARSVSSATFAAITREEMLESIERDLLIVATCEGEIAALGQIVTNRETERSLAPDLGVPFSEVVTFDGVIVAPEHRGNGLQRIFLGMAEEFGGECGAAYVAATVAEANLPSRRNFGARGFSELKIIPKYGSERILVAKRIK